jgi:hypothetical protein
LFGSFVLRLSLKRKFSQMFHHCVRVDFAYRADFLLGLRLSLERAFIFELVLALAEEAADHISYGAEPAFALKTRFIFELIFELAFSRVLVFELVDQFHLGFISHDNSSSACDC